jgi:hypothetical protein
LGSWGTPPRYRNAGASLARAGRNKDKVIKKYGPSILRGKIDGPVRTRQS